MSTQARAGSGVLAWARRHHRVLIGAVVISAVVAIPFALSTPSEYTSQARVLVPAEDTVSTGSGQTSAIALALVDYLDHGFAGDVQDALGDRAAEVETITGVQLRDEDLYLVTVSTNSSEDVRDAVLVATDTLMVRASELAADQTVRLREQARLRTEELNDQIVALEAEQQRVATELAGAKDDLADARSGGTAAEVAEAKREVEDLQAEASNLQADHHLLVTRRDGLASLVAQADQDLVTYESVGTLVSGPTTPVRAAPARTLLTFVLAILAGLAVAVGMILVLERRRRLAPAGEP
jgi:uncharacterized protein involved in exopolysaccharide biosynthesis